LTNPSREEIAPSDDIKLEKGDKPTAYSDYAAAGSPALIYEKVTPSYLDCSGANPPSPCQNFARYCSANEAGCELYTSAADGSQIPAKVSAQDNCPAECVGYATFVQNQTYFDPSQQAYFIPKTAKTCTADAVGCSQFTNLDQVAKGGEGIEYYSYLRQCVKPSDSASSCGQFYNWEGSDESGYQLKVASLKTAGTGAAAEPALTQDDSAFCNQTIYNLPATDPAYNADCRQFYNRGGGLSYHLYSSTIACSDDCHPYRLTDSNIDQNLTSAAACSGANKHWDGSQCAVCQNGGVWSADNNACVYMAVPGQATSCAAAANGCREYTGNTGNNVRNIFTDDFSDGTVGAWVGVSGGTVAPSSEAIILDAINILDLTVLLAILTKFITIPIAFGLWYWRTNRHQSGPKKDPTFQIIIAAIPKMIPFISIVPTWTVFVLYCWFQDSKVGKKTIGKAQKLKQAKI